MKLILANTDGIEKGIFLKCGGTPIRINNGDTCPDWALQIMYERLIDWKREGLKAVKNSVEIELRRSGGSSGNIVNVTTDIMARINIEEYL